MRSSGPIRIVHVEILSGARLVALLARMLSDVGDGVCRLGRSAVVDLCLCREWPIPVVCRVVHTLWASAGGRDEWCEFGRRRD